MRWVLIGALLVTMASGCTNRGAPQSEVLPSSSTEVIDPALQGSFRLDAFEPGPCAFDYRAELSLLRPDGTKAWSTPIPMALHGAGPIASGSIVIQPTGYSWGGDTGVVAVNVEDGAPVWQTTAGDDVQQAAVVDGALLLQTRQGLESLDPVDGTTGWHWRATGDVAVRRNGDRQVLPMSDGVVFVRSGSEVRAIEIVSGNEVWVVAASEDGSFAPLVGAEGRLVLVPEFFGTIRAVDAVQGQPAWTWDARPGVVIERIDMGDSPIVVVSTEAAYESPDGSVPPPDADQFVAIDVETGDELWRLDRPGQAADAVFVFDELAVIWQWDGTVRGLDARTGELHWELALVAAGSTSVSALLDGDTLLVSPSSRATELHAIDSSNGAELWKTLLPGRSFSAPLVVDDVVYIGSGIGGDSKAVESIADGRVSAIDLDSGVTRWTTEFRDAVSSTPVHTAEGLLVTSSDGPVLCD